MLPRPDECYRVSLSVTRCNSGRSVRGTWMGGFFTGDPERYVKKGSGKGHLSPLGKLEGGSFTRNLCVEEGSGNGHLSRSEPCWEPGVGPFTRTLGES
jgi:hypothetical protein